MAGPAAVVTLERPSEAFDFKSEALSEALAAVSFAAEEAVDAVSLAASEALAVVDSNRRAARPVNLDVWRSTARLADNDIMKDSDRTTTRSAKSQVFRGVESNWQFKVSRAQICRSLRFLGRSWDA